MKTVIIDYAIIDPITLANKIFSCFPSAYCVFKDIDEDFFEMRIYFCDDLKVLEDLLAKYV